MNFLQTIMGKKILMAISGILFCFFLVLHLLNNLTLFVGAETFNALVSSLEAIKPIIRVLELLLLIILVVHVYNAIVLSFNSKKARPVPYKINSQENSNLSSRTMIISGLVILLFLFVHLGTFWRTFQTINHNSNYYNIIISDNIIGFANPFITLLYMAASIFIGMHLKHGFESAFKTFGINNKKIKTALRKVAIFFWFFVPAGFFMIAMWFGIIKGLL